MPTVIEIKKYEVSYYGGGKNLRNYPYRAIIGLRDEKDTFIAAAYFYHSETAMPASDNRKTTGFISCHYAATDYPQVLDILRNERPVYVEFDERTNVANIRTSAEPVGEGEVEVG